MGLNSACPYFWKVMMSLSCVPPDFMAAVGGKELGHLLPAEACERGRAGGEGGPETWVRR